MRIVVSCGKYIGFVEATDFIDNYFYQRLYKAATFYKVDIVFVNSTMNNKEFLYYIGKIIFAEFEDSIQYFIDCALFDKLFSAELIKTNNIAFDGGVYFEDNPFIAKGCIFLTIITVQEV